MGMYFFVVHGKIKLQETCQQIFICLYYVYFLMLLSIHVLELILQFPYLKELRTLSEKCKKAIFPQKNLF